MFSNSKRLLLLGLTVFLLAFPFTSMAFTSKESITLMNQDIWYDGAWTGK